MLTKIVFLVWSIDLSVYSGRSPTLKFSVLQFQPWLWHWELFHIGSNIIKIFFGELVLLNVFIYNDDVLYMVLVYFRIL